MRRPEPDDLGMLLFVMSMVLLSLGIGFGAGQDFQRAEQAEQAEQVERTEPDVPVVYVREVEDPDGAAHMCAITEAGGVSCDWSVP